MGDEVGHDGGLAAHQLRFPVDNFSSNGLVSALLPPDFLPATGAATDADTAGGIRFPAEVMKGNESLIVKRKRGRPPKIGGQAKAVVAPAAKRSKKEEEDVCFICFDGGKLVLCDRRDCPKAYHPACVKRDESFFKRRVRWNCGWHLCNICQRNAVFMCYTCPYSLCKTCVKQADISCVRGSKGFCKTCMTTISLIENIKQGIEEVGPVDFDDTTSWEYLFKVYWVYLKDKESLTLDELTQATNPWRGLPLNHLYNYSSQGSQNNCTNRTVELRSTVGPLGIQNNQVDANVLKGRKARKQPILHNYSQERAVADKLQDGAAEWASQELLEFVSHVKSGDTSKLTHFDVQALLLEYIRKNKLRDPRRKCQIICDKRLEILFGKARVGHFEMLKLLEYHFKDGSCASSVVHAAAIDSSDNKLEECSEEVHIIVREGKRQTRQKVDEREIQINLDNFAAIDVHNMSLIYLKRSSMENLMEDAANFHDKVVGSIVRIRISGNDLNQELYRLVRVVGTGLAAESYKIGDKTAHIILKILNLDKIEDVRIDAISNQDFSEDECRRLRQSIKCGLVERLTVGEVHDKAVALQEVRIKDALEIEVLKLNHLRDRASEMGHRKELRECVKKLGLLKSPEECHRRMRKIPEVHADPRMDPVYQSDGDSEQSDTKQDAKTMPVHSNSISRSSESIAPGRGDMPCSTRAKLLRSSSFGMECKRNAYVRPKICRKEDVAPIESSPSSLELETDAARILEELRNQVDPCRITTKKNATTLANHPWYAFDASVTSFSRLAPPPENCEHQKIWYYRDPSGEVQGPFCMMQLRKWNSSGYFPVDLRVWRIVESQDKSMLLVDALSNQRGKEHEFQSDCLDSHEMASLSEHGVRLSLNINAAGTADKSNGDCDTDLTDAAKCSDDKKQPNTGSGVKGVGLGSCSQLSPEEKWESVPEVSNSSPASRDTDFPTINQNHKPECSDLPSPMPKEDGEGATCLAVEPALQLCGLNVSSQKSSSSPKMSPGGLDPVQLSSTVNPEMDHVNFKEQAEENKMDCEVEVHSQQVIPTVVQKNPSRESAQINVFQLPSKIPDLNNAVTKSQLTEAKEPSTSYLPRKELCATWNVLSTGTEYSVPVSSANQSSEGSRELATEHCLTSNATCHDMGINWSTVTSLVSETVQWAGMKFSDHPTTTSGSCDFTRTLSSHPDCNTSSWTDGPIELSTLGDESVSDLLTEVEALESLNGMASPNARMDFGDDSIDSPSNDCFSRLVGLRPPLEPGKHDAWCTNCDIQFHSQPRITEPAAEQDLLSLTSMSLPPPLTTVNLQSSHHPLGVDSHTSVSLSSPAITPGIESEVKLHSVSNHEFVSYDQNLEPQPPATSRSHDELASGDGGMMLAYVNVLRPPPCSKPEPPSSPVEEGEMELATNDFSVKPPPPHPKTVLLSSNPSPDARKGAKPSGHGSLHQGRCHGTGGGRHSSGHKDRSYHHIHSVDLGFVKGPTRPGWHRPASFNCGEGASRPLPLHRGQRVCKFYESGYCKKGASCNYLHP